MSSAAAFFRMMAVIALAAAAPAGRTQTAAPAGAAGEGPALFAQAPAEQSTPLAAVDQAYAQVRDGDDEAALRSFASADAAGQLPPAALRDAGYAAMRAGRDEDAVRYWRRAIDAARSGQLQLSAQAMLDTKREIAEVSRRWGALASLTYRGSGMVPGFGAAGSMVDSKSLQAGAEVYWRPFGYRNGRYVEVFARSFQTVDGDTGPVGRDSRQSGLGVRWKPLTQQNVVLSLSRTETHGESGDWLMQAAWSLETGTDARLDAASWLTTRAYAEAGRYIDRGRSYGLASVQAGRSFCLTTGSSCVTVFPHLVAAAEYDSALDKNLSAGVGAGIALRSWFRGTAYAAPQSYVDFLLQYRARVSGENRIKGVFFTALISF